MFDCPGYVVSTILFPQLPLVCSKLPLSRPVVASSFFSAGNANAETLTLGLVGSVLLKFPMELYARFPFGCFGGDPPSGGDEERASEGLMERMEVEEGFRWNGASNPEGIVSSFVLRLRRAV